MKKCRPYKDFGRGFYLTTIESQAQRMAKRTCRMYSGVPVVTTFSFDLNAYEYRQLFVKRFDAPTIEWAQFVLNNRNRHFVDIDHIHCNHDNKYDVVVGPVANDDIAVLFRTYTKGFIDDTSLVNGMMFRKLNDQYSFHTERSIALLSKIEAKTYE
ncbi:MAG: DUF3990 domain-containing protein [Proteobacteria bacterium]|nr:DUF3990 domain-containing protein [Pseudomonadota bacterium]